MRNQYDSQISQLQQELTHEQVQLLYIPTVYGKTFKYRIPCIIDIN